MRLTIIGAAYEAMLSAGAVSGLSVADHLRDPRYRPLIVAVAREVIAQAPSEPRTTEVTALLGHLQGPITDWIADLIGSIERGERSCEVANLDLLVALERADRLGRDLGAVVNLIAAPARAASGSLHGVPIAVKDLLAVAGTPTGNGNPSDMAGPPAQADAELVARLRAAGADVFATTALLEYAAGGLHPDVPETKNPWNPDRTASGSSGGSAALVGCGSCVAAIGTDTGGSIRIPAHFCGTVGFKPTHGALPTTGVTLLAPSLDHVGLLTSDVAWASSVWTALSGQAVPDPSAPVRVGVLTAQMHDPALQSEMAATLRTALSCLRGSADQIVDLIDVDDEPFRAIDATFGAIFGWEAWNQLGPLVEGEPGHLGPATTRLLRGLSTVSHDDYRRALATRDELAVSCADAYTGVDVLLGPAVPYVAPPTTPGIDTEQGQAAAMFTRAYNLTGAPALVLPCGWADGLPVGLQLSAPVGRDGPLLAAAAVVEAALAFTRPAARSVEWPAPAAGWISVSPAATLG